jgi:hypothetical protein
LRAKQVFVVQPTPSSQSVSSQHSAQSPSQHLWGPLHFAAEAQVPSMVQKSLVQLSPSLQSSGPPHLLALPAMAVPALPIPPTPLPPFDEPPTAEPASPPLSNSAPEQALASNIGTSAVKLHSVTSLDVVRLT